MREFAAGLPHALFSLLYPDDCRICAAPLIRFTRAPVCDQCIQAVEPLAATGQCTRCGLPFANEAPLHGANLCGLCRRGATDFDWARGYGAYEGVLRRLIQLLKYDGMEPLARPLGARLAQVLSQAEPVDLIIPVPLDRRRERSRGFNQSELIARELSRITGVPIDRRTLRRERPTETQTGLTHSQRRLNVQGAFRVRHPERVAGKRVALVDDVITTGATVDACARTLKRAGAARVIVLALARARRRLLDVPAPAPAAEISREAACGA